MSVKTVVFVGGDRLGRGDDELGRALMLAAMKNLGKMEGGLPSHVMFMNAGVLLCCEGSHALADLRGLSAAGVELLCCGTCLDWFEKKSELTVGRVSTMVEILSLMNSAERVMRI